MVGYYVISIYILLCLIGFFVYKSVGRKARQGMPEETCKLIFGNVSDKILSVLSVLSIFFLLSGGVIFIFACQIEKSSIGLFYFPVILLILSPLIFLASEKFPFVINKNGPGWLFFQNQEVYLSKDCKVKKHVGYFIAANFSFSCSVKDEHEEKTVCFSLDFQFLNPNNIIRTEVSAIIRETSKEICSLVREWLSVADSLTDDDGCYIARNLRRYSSSSKQVEIKISDISFELHVIRYFPDDNQGDDGDPLDSLPPPVGGEIILNNN